MADLETLKQRSFVSYNGYEFLTAEVTARDFHALIAVAEAAQDFIDRGREWIGGAKYCPECMAEGWHYEGCKSGQEIFDSRKALAEAVEALSALKDA